MSGFGHTGPQKDYVSYGPTLQALSGYTLQMRHHGGTPAGWGYSYADMSRGYSGALAVLLFYLGDNLLKRTCLTLTALLSRHCTGRQQKYQCHKS